MDTLEDLKEWRRDTSCQRKPKPMKGIHGTRQGRRRRRMLRHLTMLKRHAVRKARMARTRMYK